MRNFKTIVIGKSIPTEKMKVIGFLILGCLFVEVTSRTGNVKLFNYTTDKITKEYRMNDGLIRDKCMKKLIQEAVNQFGSTYMFIADGYYHECLLRNLQMNFVHSYFTEPNLLSNSKTETFDNLLIFQNKFKLRDVIKKKKPFQATKFFLLVKDYKDAIEKFEILWQHRLVNAVASYVENLTVYYYTYFPYSQTHCGSVGKPYLLAECNIVNGVFSQREKLFPRKVNNLKKCPIDVTFTENVPSSYYGETKKLTGWEIELMNEILQRLNGVPKYKILNTRKSIYQTSNGYSRLVEKSEIGGGLVVSLRSLVKTDFCMYGMSLCLTWIEPKNKGSPFSSDFLVKVFPQSVWILLLVLYFLMATIIWVFFKRNYKDILFKLLPYLLGTTIRTKKTSKRLGALWLWFCLIINAIYQSGFQSILLVPSLPQQLRTTEEVMNSNLKILGVKDVITDAIPYFQKRYNLSSRRFRNRKLSYEDWVYRMVVKKDSVFLGFKETTRYHLERTELETELYIPDECVIKYLLAFVLKRNSHLTEVIVKLSNRLNENGFLAYFIRKHLSRESRKNIPKKLKRILKPIKGDNSIIPPPIDLNKIFVIFLYHAGGILLSLIAFVIELMSTWNWKKIKKQAVKELKSAWTCN